MVEPYFDRLSGLIKQDINMFTGGINTYMDKAFLNPDQLPYSMNMTMYKPPMISTRASREHLLFNVTANTAINSLWAYDENLIAFTIFAKDGTGTQDIWSAEYIDGTGWNKIRYSGLPTQKQIYYTYCRAATDEYLYVGNPDCKVKMTRAHGQQYPFITDILRDDHYGIPCWHKGRLFLANPDTNTITYSALNDFDNFTPVPEGADPLDIDYSSYAGDFFVTNARGRIRMITSFDDKLVIFCEHSIHLLYGDTPLINSSSQFQLVDLSLNLGCQAPLTVSASGGDLFWMGDDREIYEYTGSSMDMISRPNASRYVNRGGGISNLKIPENTFLTGDNDIDAIATANSNKYYIQLPILVGDDTVRYPLFVYDVYNKIWWAEDGDLEAIANFSIKKDHIIMAHMNDILKTTNKFTGVDYLYNEETGESDREENIYYEFHTKVYAPDSVSGRKTISQVWLQASANCDVFLTDSWLSSDAWSGPFPNDSLKKIGEIGTRGTKEMNSDYLKTYDASDYEQQCCIVPKMYGERLNTFQIVIRGWGASKFYLMQRKWRTNENV